MDTTSGHITTVSPMKARIPNLLTAGRVVLAIAFFAVLAPWDLRRSPIYLGTGVDYMLILAAVMFIIAAITDALDGHLARKWGVTSAFGRIMDPFADKVLVLGAFVLLAGPGFACELHLAPDGSTTRLGAKGATQILTWSISGVQPWMVVVILARELLVTSIRGAVESEGKSFAASWSGKAKMILQCVCVPAVLLLLNAPPDDGERNTTWPYYTIQFLVGATVLVTAWSGVPYITRGIAALRASKPIPPAITIEGT